MDFAYDHVAEQTLPGDRALTPTPARSEESTANVPAPAETRPSLQSEFQETFKAFSNSPWGSRLGGFWGKCAQARESYYEGARREAEAASGEALKGLTDLKQTLVSRTRGLSAGESQIKDTATTGKEKTEEEAGVQENETFIARFKSEAAKRLKEIEKAEDAADEALLRFGTNIANFLKEAVSVAPPSDQEDGRTANVLFESKDSSGKRVIHASRSDAQLHVIHTTMSSFTHDPNTSGDQWLKFKSEFDIDSKTEEIAKDLDKHSELRNAMEKLVPEKVEYKDFWCRYYFLRHVVESQEERRKELLKASANDTEEVAWDEDSDDEAAAPSTPQQTKAVVKPQPDTANRIAPAADATNPASSPTHSQIPTVIIDSSLKPEGRRSHDEKSVADSDASYDLVSGTTSRTPESPGEEVAKDKEREREKVTKVDEESDEEDWE